MYVKHYDLKPCRWDKCTFSYNVSSNDRCYFCAFYLPDYLNTRLLDSGYFPISLKIQGNYRLKLLDYRGTVGIL